MSRVALSELTDLITDGTHASPVRTESGVPVLSAMNVKDGQLSMATSRYTSKAELAAFEKRVRPQAGDVLLTIVGTIGRAALLDEAPKAVFQRSVAILRPKTAELHGRYLLHATQSRDFVEQLRRATNQSSQAGVYLGKLKALTITLPPLDEQRRIAAILDHADVLGARRRQALTYLDELTRSIFIDMFGNPLKSLDHVERCQLGTVARIITGNTPPRSIAANYGSEIEWIKSDNLGGLIATKAQERLSSTGRGVARVAPAGSVLVTCIAGSPNSIGKASLVDREVAFNQQINAVVPGPRILGRFVLEQLRVSPQLVRVKSTGGMKGLVSKSSFAAIEIIVPPIERQREFEARAAAIHAQMQRLEASASASSVLLHSLQTRAFSGRMCDNSRQD